MIDFCETLLPPDASCKAAPNWMTRLDGHIDIVGGSQAITVRQKPLYFSTTLVGELQRVLYDGAQYASIGLEHMEFNLSFEFDTRSQCTIRFGRGPDDWLEIWQGPGLNLVRVAYDLHHRLVRALADRDSGYRRNEKFLRECPYAWRILFGEWRPET